MIVPIDRYGSLQSWINVWVANKTVRSLYNVCHTWVLLWQKTHTNGRWSSDGYWHKCQQSEAVYYRTCTIIYDDLKTLQTRSRLRSVIKVYQLVSICDNTNIYVQQLTYTTRLHTNRITGNDLTLLLNYVNYSYRCYLNMKHLVYGKK